MRERPAGHPSIFMARRIVVAKRVLRRGDTHAPHRGARAMMPVYASAAAHTVEPCVFLRPDVESRDLAYRLPRSRQAGKSEPVFGSGAADANPSAAIVPTRPFNKRKAIQTARRPIDAPGAVQARPRRPTAACREFRVRADLGACLCRRTRIRERGVDLDTRPSPHPPIRPFAHSHGARRTAHGARRTADDAWRGRLPAFGRRAAADSVSSPSSRNAARQARRPIARRMPRSTVAPSGERLAARFFLFGATIWPYPFRAELDLIRRPIIDPEVLPIETTGADLPVVRPSSMTPAGLRERFAEPPEWTQEPAEAQLAHGVDPRSAAVLVPLVVRERGLTVLLTQRADHLNDHAGQISFPGGRREPDDRDANATALREAREEIALAHERVELLGALPDYLTGTGFCVTPVVGLVHPPFTVQPDTLEVAEIFEVPLDFLMNPAHHQVRVLRWEGGERRFFAMPYPRGPVGGQYFIWGATAGMLRNLYRFLSA